MLDTVRRLLGLLPPEGTAATETPNPAVVEQATEAVDISFEQRLANVERLVSQGRLKDLAPIELDELYSDINEVLKFVDRVVIILGKLQKEQKMKALAKKLKNTRTRIEKLRAQAA